MEPAAISASPAVTTMCEEVNAPEMPAASANGTVNPSAMPITTSRTVSLPEKCCSICCRLKTLGVAPKCRERLTFRLKPASPPIGGAGSRTRSVAVTGAPAHDQIPHERSEEHTSELQSLRHLVCRLLLEKKKKYK